MTQPDSAKDIPATPKSKSFVKYFSIPIAVIAVFLSPYIFLGSDVFVNPFDYLDSIHVYYKLIAESGAAFKESEYLIPNMLGGIPRISLPSELNAQVLFYYLFGPFGGHVINIFFPCIVGFISMYLLLTRHFQKIPKPTYLAIFVALAFSLKPFNHFRGLSIAAMPLVVYAFLNFHKKDYSLKDFVILFLLPFYSIFTHVNFFLIFAMTLYGAIHTFRQRNINYPFWLAIGLFSLTSLAIEYRLLIWKLFGNGFESHRNDWSLSATKSILPILTSGLKNFIHGSGHVNSLHTIYILTTVGFTAIVILVSRSFKQILTRQYMKILSIIVLTSLWYAGMKSFLVLFDFKPLNSFLTLFQINRMDALHPLLWYTLFFVSLKIISEKISFFKAGTIISITLVTMQIGYNAYKTRTFQDAAIRLIRIIHPEYGNTFSLNTSYREYYSEKVFESIKEYIGKDQSTYHTINIGFHPAIAQYHGFHTLDAYSYNYPLEYKRKFRKIIEKELLKSSRLRGYFDGWGNRCYIFSSELNAKGSKVFPKHVNRVIYNLEINTHELQNMGGDYVFSAVKIDNYKDIHLSNEKVFEHPDEYFRIHVYEVNDNVPVMNLMADIYDKNKVYELSESSYPLTDKNWKNGVARNFAGIFVENNPINKEHYVTGTTIKFANGESRIISHTIESLNYINIYFENEKLLNGDEVGHPHKITIAKE